MNFTTVTDSMPRKRTISYKWGLGLIMVSVIALGWKYPVLGFVVPIAMVSGVLGGIIRGRWVCGNVCPRGSFLDTGFNLLAKKRDIPNFLKISAFRWTVLSLLMGFMAFRLSLNPKNIDHWGLVFWQMCLITTIVAVGLGLRYSARSWCSICPVGTMASHMGGEKHALLVAASCKSCGLCKENCPMQLEIPKYRLTGKLEEKDCLKCSSCMNACPRNDVLSWPYKKAA